MTRALSVRPPVLRTFQHGWNRHKAYPRVHGKRSAGHVSGFIIMYVTPAPPSWCNVFPGCEENVSFPTVCGVLVETSSGGILANTNMAAPTTRRRWVACMHQPSPSSIHPPPPPNAEANHNLEIALNSYGCLLQACRRGKL